MTNPGSHSLTRRTFLGAAAAAAGTLAPRAAATLQAQPSAPIVTRTDVIYGRVEGSALLANLAYPDGPGLRPAIISVHGGRWRAEARRQASPMNHVSATTKPILVIHSDDDKSVPVQQAVDFVGRLKAANVPHRFVHYTDRGHMGIIDDVIREARVFIAEMEPKQ